MLRTFSLLLLSVVLLSPCAWAQTKTEPPDKDRIDSGAVYMQAEMLNLFLWRNDTDFDKSKPLWDEDGQSVGAFATVFTPTFTWNINRDLRITYQAEIGLNYWSRNDPDVEDMLSPSILVMKHRELHASGELDDFLGIKVGYGRFQDPTGLFLNHWIGTAQVWAGEDEDRLGLFVGQVPEFSHEGISVTENNFARDIFVYGARFDLRIDHGWFMAVGMHNLYDTHLPGQERWLLCPNLHFDAGEDELRLSLDLMVQVGQAEGQTVDGGIQDLLAWAAQAHLTYDTEDEAKLWPSVLDLNVLVYSPDDAHADNGDQFAFFSSGKNNSATLMLTEDEFRDWYDNYDERFGKRTGGFYNNRAGLFLVDLKATWRLARQWDIGLVVAAASVLKSQNALGNTFAGVELDMTSHFWIGDAFAILVAGGVLVPGPAAGALVNYIDRKATDPIGMVELAVLVRY